LQARLVVVKEIKVLEFQEVDRGLHEALLVSGETSPLVTPERLAELHERGMLARPPLEVESVGMLLILKKGQTAGGLKHYLLDLGGPMDLYA
jgi:hypothetical protein